MSQPRNNVSYDYSGTHVLVTGGTAGIGAGIAAAFREAGAHVTITGTRGSSDEYNTDLSNYEYRQFRATEPDDVEHLSRKLDKLDILINNAGGTGKQPEDFMRTLEVNLASVFRLSKACSNLLKQSSLEGGASIVNLSSLYANFAHQFYPGYGAAKAGVINLTKSLASIWAKPGIRVNAILVGSIVSRMTEEYAADPAVTSLLMEHTLIQRWGLPQDIAGAALYLSSRSASYITGETLTVDGGYSVIDRVWEDSDELKTDI